MLRIALPLLIVFAIFGCVKLPDKETLATKTHIKEGFDNNLNNITTESSIDDLDYVSTLLVLFDDKDLEKILKKALDANTNLLTLESQIRQARANAKINTANMFPKINANLNNNYSDNNYKQIQTSVTQNTTNATLSFSWEADIFGKLNALRLASKQQILQSIQNLKSAQVTLIGDVASYYLTIRQTQQLININTQIANNLLQIYNLTQQKYNLGLIGLDSVATTKSNYLTQQNTLQNLGYTLEQNKNALLVLLNSNDIGFDINTDYSFTKSEIPNTSSMPSYVIFNRPDVSASIFAFNASLYQRYNKKMALFPTLSISGNLGQILFSPQQSIGDMVWQIAGSLATPLINRQSLTQDYINAKENTRQAFYALQNSINVAVGEIENAIKNIESQNISLNNLIEHYEINSDTFSIMQHRYTQNLIDDISLLEYENTSLRSKANLLSGYLAQNQAAISFYKAFGGSFSKSKMAKDEDLILKEYKESENRERSHIDVSKDF